MLGGIFFGRGELTSEYSVTWVRVRVTVRVGVRVRVPVRVRVRVRVGVRVPVRVPVRVRVLVRVGVRVRPLVRKQATHFFRLVERIIFFKKCPKRIFPSEFVKLGSEILFLFLAEKLVVCCLFVLKVCPILALFFFKLFASAAEKDAILYHYL